MVSVADTIHTYNGGVVRNRSRFSISSGPANPSELESHKGTFVILAIGHLLSDPYPVA